MKFTHRDIEEDRAKPVGSLFAHLMDRDSMPSRGHRHVAARHLNAHSLPNTQLSLYAHDMPQRSATPLRGRRHFSNHGGRRNVEGESDGRSSSRGVRRTATPHGGVDHIGLNMTPRSTGEPSPTRQRRGVRSSSAKPPSSRPFWLGDDDDRVGGARDQRHSSSVCSSTVGNRGPTQGRRAGDHLILGSLLPVAMKPVERPVPPQPPVKPRTSGIRLFPERRSHSADSAHRGVRMVRPPPHWRSVAERQWDLLELGIACRETPAPLYSNESHIAQGGGPVIVHETPEVSQQVQRWRGGRRHDITPQRRRYDIITGRPLIC